MLITYCHTGITDYADILLHRLEIKQPFTNDNKEIVAFVKNSNLTVLKKEEFNRIRNKNSSLFSETDKDICNACHSYKDFLRKAPENHKELFGKLSLEQKYKKYACRFSF